MMSKKLLSWPLAAPAAALLIACLATFTPAKAAAGQLSDSLTLEIPCR